MARPVKKLDWDRVEWLLKCGCNGVEIASEFDMHPDTFYRKVEETYNIGFTEFSAINKSKGDVLLREAQFGEALDKDKTMMIWLGKQRLGQKENVSELKDLVTHELRAGLKKLSEESRSEAAVESVVAPQPLVSDS